MIHGSQHVVRAQENIAIITVGLTPVGVLNPPPAALGR